MMPTHLDYLDACPVRGFRRGGIGESLEVEVEVRVNDTEQSPNAATPKRETNGHVPQQ